MKFAGITADAELSWITAVHRRCTLHWKNPRKLCKGQGWKERRSESGCK